MPKTKTHGLKWRALASIFFAGFFSGAEQPRAAEKLNTAFFSPAPGASAVIWVAKEARLFDKHGLDVAPVLIPSSVRALQAILAGETAIGESAGPAVASARIAGSDVLAIAGNSNILTYYFVTLPGIKRSEDLKGKIGANHSPGTIADFALRISLSKLGLDPLKDVSTPDRCSSRSSRRDAEGDCSVHGTHRSGKAHCRQARVPGDARSDLAADTVSPARDLHHS